MISSHLFFNTILMKNILALISAASLSLGSVGADEKKPVKISSTAIVSGGQVGIKSTLSITADQVSAHLAHGDDPRVEAQDFTSGSILWTNEQLTLGARWLLLDQEKFWEIYGKLTGDLDIFKGADAWIRVGVTAPAGINLSSGANIKLTDHDSLFLLGSHQEAFSDGTQGTLWKAQLTHDFGNGISLYGGLDHWDGDDASFPKANLLMNEGPGFNLFRIHGQSFTGNIGARYTHDDTTAHLKASYNEAEYWNFTGEISRKLSDHMTLSGWLLIDTRDGVDTTGYVGVKWSF